MNEKLTDYVLGLLSDEEKRDLERHLANNESDRAELARLQQVMVTLVEAVPRETPRTTLAALQAKLSTSTPIPEDKPVIRPAPPALKPSSWFYPLALAASLVLAAGSLWWGVSSSQEARRIQTENDTLNEWLAYGDLTMVSLKDAGDNAIGTVLVSPRDYALFILNTPPPAGKSYQAWGRANETVTSLAITENRLIPVKSEGFERIGVSLEPLGGSPQPTEPLGGIPLN